MTMWQDSEWLGFGTPPSEGNMATRTITLEITGDVWGLKRQMERYAAWPAWRRWIWRNLGR